jgi:hypothetical protein
VFTSDGESVGVVEQVLGDDGTDIFDGLVIDTRIGPGGHRFVDAEVAVPREHALLYSRSPPRRRSVPPAARAGRRPPRLVRRCGPGGGYVHRRLVERADQHVRQRAGRARLELARVDRGLEHRLRRSEAVVCHGIVA